MTRQDVVHRMLDTALESRSGAAVLLDEHDQPANDPVRIGSVTLAVRDLDGVAQFYRDVVGLQDVHASPGLVALGAGGRTLLSLEHRPDALPDDPASAGLFHTAFLLPTRGDLGAWLRHVGQRGFRLDGAADHLVSEAFYLHDPEGNGIEVYADRPRTAWRWQDGVVMMANDNPDMAGILAAARHEWAGAPPGTTIGHVHLRVGDVKTATEFYVPLGLDVTTASPAAAFLSSGGYHHHLAYNVWQSRGAGRRDPNRGGLVSVAMVGLAQEVRDPWGTVLTPG